MNTSISSVAATKLTYVTCLEDICEAFPDPLTLFHKEKLRHLSSLKSARSFSAKWSAFKEQLNGNSVLEVDESVLD